MSKEQNSTFSGSLYDVFDSTHQDYKQNRMPRIGQKVEFEDGRKFVFCKCTTAGDIAAGDVVEAPAVLEETAIDVAAAAGDYEIEVSQASITANQWAGGFVVVVLGTGVGYTYKIKKNAASDASDDVLITLYDPLKTALATTDDVTIVPIRTNNVIQGTADCDAVGIAVAAAPASTDSLEKYFWAQYAGIGFCKGTVGAAGAALQPAASGALGAADATSVIVAHGVEAGASNSVINMCFLT